MNHITKRQLIEMLAVADDSANVVITNHDGDEHCHEFDVRCISPSSEVQLVTTSTEAQDALKELEDYGEKIGWRIIEIEKVLSKLEEEIKTEAEISNIPCELIEKLRSEFDSLKGVA